ncbi:carbamoyltransferase C-terminal domain-containing protein [Chitinophaga sancti]|uniref:carbamoyltransferase family protein n=1 Tax=Chitinophaga sancti TaxID=1004 RepID=UPI002A755105|nr:carbamoyltransferase C-terminal domain-containing protein [Chitinophaga sancti]WPQ66231.1 carbamoyltransferase C-terminal domain-containing protein [Chitinophaga sancti]
MKKYYVGLSSTFHDSSIAILNDQGTVLFAEATERKLQYKRGLSCPADNFDIGRILKKYCDKDASFVIATSWSEDYLQLLNRMERMNFFSEKSLTNPKLQLPSKYIFPKASIYTILKLQHQYLKNAGTGSLLAIQQQFSGSAVSFRSYPHHHTHAAYACYSSPYEDAACAIIDGYGEGGSISLFHYQNDQLKEVSLHKGPQSLGWIYEMITTLCGFDWFTGEEWKVMGLAPYGNIIPEAHSLLKELCWYDNKRLHYPDDEKIITITSKLQAFKRLPESSPWSAADLAFTGQTFFAELTTLLLKDLESMKLSSNLVIGGGCGLNSSFNGTVTSQTGFARLFVPSAPADDGNSIGAAMLALKEDNPAIRLGSKPFFSPYLGSVIQEDAIKRMLQLGNISKIRHLPLSIHKETAVKLAEGKLVAWVQGRAEFGPRSLGNRSILADPRPADMKNRINSNVKFREEFRPFAPSILHEYGHDYFENYEETPYMERTLIFKEAVKAKIPAVVHANHTGRLQTVKKEWNSAYYKLIKSFYDITGVPIVLNTSLNIMGKPILHSLEDAIGMFYTTGLDVLVVNDYMIEK